LRVMYGLPSAHRSVAGRLTLDVLTFHDPRQVEPSVCFLEDGPLVGECTDRLGLATAVIPLRARRWFNRRRVVQDLAAHCRALGIRLVHSLGTLGHLIGGRAARKAHLPAVW